MFVGDELSDNDEENDDVDGEEHLENVCDEEDNIVVGDDEDEDEGATDNEERLNHDPTGQRVESNEDSRMCGDIQPHSLRGGQLKGFDDDEDSPEHDDDNDDGGGISEVHEELSLQRVES